MRRGSNSGRGGPGLLRTMGRTAVVAGTATAVSKGVSNSMNTAAQQQAAAAQAQAAAEQARFDAAVAQAVDQHLTSAAPTPAATPAPAAAPAPAAGISPTERIAMLQQLAELKGQGILSDAEFEAEKARILAS